MNARASRPKTLLTWVDKRALAPEERVRVWELEQVQAKAEEEIWSLSRRGPLTPLEREKLGAMRHIRWEAERAQLMHLLLAVARRQGPANN